MCVFPDESPIVFVILHAYEESSGRGGWEYFFPKHTNDWKKEAPCHINQTLLALEDTFVRAKAQVT